MFRAWLDCVAALVIFGLLGGLTANAPPAPVDTALSQAAFGHATALALLLTKTGLLAFLLTAGVVAITVAVAVAPWRARLIFAVVALALTHVASDVTKDIFKRPRPVHWIGMHETSFSFPSGHAATATAFFALLGYFVWRSNMPATPRAVLACGFVLWALGICWSRLALGAHYPTDIAGGILLGAAVVAFMRALCGHLGVELEAPDEAGGQSPASSQENRPR